MGEGRAATGSNKGIIEQARAFGASDEELAPLFEKNSDTDEIKAEVEPENIDAVRLFIHMRTQWRLVSRTFSKGGVQLSQLIHTGLDYSCLPAIASWLRIDASPETLGSLRVIEDACLEIYNRRLSR
ncbi:MAG TPA: DUF1799 domain-containing protein [Rhizomicrobium sp.]